MAKSNCNLTCNWPVRLFALIQLVSVCGFLARAFGRRLNLNASASASGGLSERGFNCAGSGAIEGSAPD